MKKYLLGSNIENIFQIINISYSEWTFNIHIFE